MASVYIVGTDHRLQVADGRSSRDQVTQFRVFLIEQCAGLGIATIAEEMSIEAVRQGREVESVCEGIAQELGTKHLYCDPETPVREQHGIRQESDLEMDVFFGRLSPIELPGAIRREHSKREAIWLECLRNLSIWPVLFVCGARHALFFNVLLEAAGIESEVIVADWSPNPPLDPASERPVRLDQQPTAAEC